MPRHMNCAATVVVLLTAAPISLLAQGPPAAIEVGAATRAIVMMPAKMPTKLTVTSPAFAEGGDIPFENTQYKDNTFPGLAWTKGPAETKSYVIIMQDTDGVRNGMPFLHWTMLNIPATVTKLDPGMATPPAGSQYGQNYKGMNQPYLGPRTPAGPKHRYHMQVFALDAVITLEANAPFTALMTAMNDHILVSGELIGLGQVMPQE